MDHHQNLEYGSSSELFRVWMIHSKSKYDVSSKSIIRVWYHHQNLEYDVSIKI